MCRMMLARMLVGASALLASTFCLGQSFPSEEQLERLAATMSLDDRVKDIQATWQQSFRSQVVDPAIGALDQRSGDQRLSSKDRAEVVERLSNVLVRLDVAALRALLLQPYRRLTADDVEETIAFFGSPAGQRLNRAMGDFQRDVMTSGLMAILQQPWSSAIQETRRITDTARR